MKRIHPTRKQRRDMNEIGRDVPRCYSGRPTREQRRDLPGNHRYVGIGEVVFIDEPETITINGEQVPATIVKDPTK